MNKEKKSIEKKEKTFDEHWAYENDLWSLSMAESFRQRDEREEKRHKRWRDHWSEVFRKMR